MPNTILCKFGRKTDMESLFNDGELYLQTLETFRNLEHNERGDKYEGSVSMRSDKNGKITLVNKETGDSFKLDMTDSKVIERHSEVSGLHIYCLYCLTFEEHEGMQLGQRIEDGIVSGFGDYSVVILDAYTFMEKVKAAVEELGFELLSRKVNYIELKDYSGKMGPFTKDQSFAHQNEFRIVLMGKGRPEGPLKFSIGSLEDIALIGPSKGIKNLQVEFEDL